jgi:hypothetical protein
VSAVKPFGLVLAALAALSVSACVSVKEPIGTSVGYVNDGALEGLWIGKPSDDKSIGYYHVILNDDATMTVVGIAPRSGKDKASWGTLELTTVVLGANHYMNARETSEDGKPKPPDDASYPLYYTVKGDTLSVFAFDSAKVEDAIKAGRIEGTITKDKFGDTVAITADGAHLDAFLKAPDAPGMFSPVLELHRPK